MKKAAKKKLALAKETVRHLELGHVKGGTGSTGCATQSCNGCGTFNCWSIPQYSCQQEFEPMATSDC
jgi:hypothetical protein